MKAGEQGEGRHEAPAVVDERQARLGRRCVGLAGEAHPSSHALEDVVVARLVAAGPVHAEAAE